MDCKATAVDQLNSGRISVAEYERMIAECENPTQKGSSVSQAVTTATTTTTNTESTEPSASATVSASLPKDTSMTENGNTFTHATLIIVSLVALIIIGRKFWNSSPVARAGIIVVGALITHDAMHHFFKRGFVYSVRTKLNV